MKILDRAQHLTTNAMLRYAIGTVFLWFGIDKFIHTENWMGYLPQFVYHLPFISASVFLTLNAWFEIALGVLLILGVAIFPVAALTGLYTLAIVIVLGANEISIRDNALVGICLVLVMEENARRKHPLSRRWMSALVIAYLVLLLVFGLIYLRGA